MALDNKAFNILKSLSPLGDILLIGRPDCSGSVCDPMAAIGSLSKTVTVLDNLRCADIVCDLNDKVELDRRFDTIFDCGTIEHIANVGQCLLNYHNLLRVGGRLVVNTMSDGFQTHGFWQVNPQLFYSLFGDSNGYCETKCWSYRGIFSNWSRLWEEPKQRRQEFRIQLPRLLLMVTTKAKEASLGWPSQPYWESPAKVTNTETKIRMVVDIARSLVRSTL